MAVLAIALLTNAHSASAYEAFENGLLRFGTGAEASVNTLGNLQQPFYWDANLSNWFKLTYSSYLSVPGTPVLGTVTPADSSYSVAFSAFASNGGSVILDYTVTCDGVAGTTADSSPITVGSLNNGTTYVNCSVTADQSGSASYNAATRGL